MKPIVGANYKISKKNEFHTLEIGVKVQCIQDAGMSGIYLFKDTANKIHSLRQDEVTS
jgi:hypothetical protein